MEPHVCCHNTLEMLMVMITMTMMEVVMTMMVMVVTPHLPLARPGGLGKVSAEVVATLVAKQQVLLLELSFKNSEFPFSTIIEFKPDRMCDLVSGIPFLSVPCGWNSFIRLMFSQVQVPHHLQFGEPDYLTSSWTMFFLST